MIFGLLVAGGMLLGQESAELSAAKGIDREMRQVREIPAERQRAAIQDLARRIRRQPPAYLAGMAFNLALELNWAHGRAAANDVALTLVDAVRRGTPDESVYTSLAEVARYGRARVSLDDPRYRAALAKLAAVDMLRGEADFTLSDLDGRSWTLKSLRGHVVVVNFWATWCPPCRKEIPVLKSVNKRFQTRGLLILAISDEEPTVLRKYVGEEGLSFPVLLDSGDRVKKLFAVGGIPHTLVYDSRGRLAAQALGGASERQLIKMIKGVK